MHPILLSIGPVQLFSLSIFLVLSWVIWSFTFWRHLKDSGVEDDKIFDITFYTTIVAFITARLAFVALNWQLFSDTLLKVVAIWVSPGLSLWGGIIGGTVTAVVLARAMKVRVSFIFDSIAFSLPITLLIGLIGTFLDGATIGKTSLLPWAVSYVGHPLLRHPVQLYEMIALLLLIGLLWLIEKQAVKHKWPYGLVGVWFFVLFSLIVFALDFATENSIYWFSLTVNQWVAVAFFCEGIGVLYVKGEMRQRISPFVRIHMTSIGTKLKGAYDAVSKRLTRRNKATS